MGAYQCPLPPPIGTLFGYWVDQARGDVARKAGVDHDHVFLRCHSGSPFTQQTFSKYTTAAFKEIAGAALNLQIVRRIFTEGAWYSPPQRP